MKIHETLVPITTPLTSPAPEKAKSTLSEKLTSAIKTEVQSYFPVALHPQERASLADTLKQAFNEQIHALLPQALHIESDTKEKAQGAGWMLGGAMMQGAGKRIGAAGGLGAKVFGAGIGMAGKVSEEYGKDKLERAGNNDNSTKGHNAYAGFYRGFGDPDSKK